jgi:HEAT repeat protein
LIAAAEAQQPIREDALRIAHMPDQLLDGPLPFRVRMTGHVFRYRTEHGQRFIRLPGELFDKIAFRHPRYVFLVIGIEFALGRALQIERHVPRLFWVDRYPIHSRHRRNPHRIRCVQGTLTFSEDASMSRYSTFFVVALVAACTTPAHTAENLGARVAAAPDGTVAFHFPARAGVCGDGATFIMEILGPNQHNIYTANGTSVTNYGISNMERECVEGPVRVVLTKRGGDVVDFEPYVGPAKKNVRTDLGAVTVQEAGDYLVALGAQRPDFANDAFMAASLGNGSRISVSLVKYAGDRRTIAGVRESAVKWIGRTADREGTVDQVLLTLREVVQESEAQTSLRERALRSIGQFSRGGSEIRSVYARLDAPELRERALRIFAEVGGRENEQFIQNAALDAREHTAVRERAIRLLGDELGQLDAIRAMYARLDEVQLRERAVRSVADHLTSESAAWIRTIAENENEHNDIRHRAVRTLGEAGYIAHLRAMYSRVGDDDLRDRIIRVAGEHGSAEDRRWIETVAVDERQPHAARDRAVRVLAEHGLSTARLISLFDEVKDYELRDRLLRLLGERDEDAAVDKLLNVAQNESDSDLRRRAARLLAESDHPRARDFIRTQVLR